MAVHVAAKNVKFIKLVESFGVDPMTCRGLVFKPEVIVMADGELI